MERDSINTDDLLMIGAEVEVSADNILCNVAVAEANPADEDMIGALEALLEPQPEVAEPEVDEVVEDNVPLDVEVADANPAVEEERPDGRKRSRRTLTGRAEARHHNCKEPGCGGRVKSLRDHCRCVHPSVAKEVVDEVCKKAGVTHRTKTWAKKREMGEVRRRGKRYGCGLSLKLIQIGETSLPSRCLQYKLSFHL